MLRDYLRLSMKSLRRRSLRSWLTILGIVIGVAAVVALIAIGEGMQRSVEQQFNTIGYNTIILGEAAGKALIPETRTPTVPNRTSGRGGAAEDAEQEDDEETAEEDSDNKTPLDRKPPGDLTLEEIEALKAQYRGEGKPAVTAEADAGNSVAEEEAVDLVALRAELLAAVARGEMTPAEGAMTYVSTGVQAGEWTRAEAPRIMQQFAANAGASPESGDEAMPTSRDGMQQPQMGLDTSGMSGIEVLDILSGLPEVAAAGAQRNQTAMVTSEGLQGVGILRLVGMTSSMPEDFPLYFEGFDIGDGLSCTEEYCHVVVLGPGVANDLKVGVGGVELNLAD